MEAAAAAVAEEEKADEVGAARGCVSGPLPSRSARCMATRSETDLRRDCGDEIAAHDKSLDFAENSVANEIAPREGDEAGEPKAYDEDEVEDAEEDDKETDEDGDESVASGVVRARLRDTEVFLSSGVAHREPPAFNFDVSVRDADGDGESVLIG